MNRVSEIITTVSDPIVITRYVLEGDRVFRHRDTISFIIPTIGRSSLAEALQSVELQHGDEILVARAHVPLRHEFGAPERMAAIARARGSWLSFMDDDDRYAVGHREIMATAIRDNPHAYPVIFRMRFPNGELLWDETKRDSIKKDRVPEHGKPLFMNGNVGSPIIFVPNIPEKLGTFTPDRFGDFQFLNSSKWPRRKFIFRTEIIAEISRVHSRHVSVREIRERSESLGGGVI